MNPLPPKPSMLAKIQDVKNSLYIFIVSRSLLTYRGGAGLVLLENHARFTEITLQFTGF